MATTYHNAIQQLYVAYFNRPADPAGLDFWETVLEGNGGNTAVVSAEFSKSAEYTAEYNQVTNAGVVTQIYQNLFGHAPDSAGLAFWVKALNDKAMTVANMVTEVAKGAQGTDKIAFDSKVVVATAFTNALNTDAEKAGYNNADAQEAAKELLAGIKTAAQATAAIVPATLDASVAAVIKAGVAFTLESGLAALGEAQEAKADFLEQFGEDNDIDDADDADVAAAVSAAAGDLADLIADADFPTSSEGVQAAMIADQVEYNADALEAANEALEAAQEDVAEIDGLDDAIAAATAAEEAAEEAADAAEEAAEDFLIAGNTFEVRNDDVTVNGDGTVTATVDGEAVDVVVLVDGALEIAEDIDADDYVGLTALVNAGNAAIAAARNAEEAANESLLAQLDVSMTENELTAVTGVTFTLTTPTSPYSMSEVADELNALVAANHANLNTFRGQIATFVANNPADLAAAVVAAEQGGLAQAKAAVAAVTGLRQADASVKADAAVTAAEGDLDALVEVVGGEVVLVADNTTVVAELNGDGELEFATGYDADDFGGTVADYIAAHNKAVAADEAWVATGIAGTAAAFVALPANDALLDAVIEQQGFIDAAPAASDEAAYADYIAALGVEGTQDAVDELSDALEALEAAQAAAEELESLNDAIDTAIDDFEANDFNAPVVVDGAEFGKTGSDIFVAGTVNATIGSFGRSGDDVLYIGEGYKLNTSDDLDDGVNADLEVFFVQSGANTKVIFETKAYGSETGDTHTITLTGVAAEDLTFENGIITLS